MPKKTNYVYFTKFVMTVAKQGVINTQILYS